MSDNEETLMPTNDSNHAAQDERIDNAFGSLQQSIGARASKADEARVSGIREAIAAGNNRQAQEHLTAVQQESSWLYEELMKHPEISAILQELSIMGL